MWNFHMNCSRPHQGTRHTVLTFSLLDFLSLQEVSDLTSCQDMQHGPAMCVCARAQRCTLWILQSRNETQRERQTGRENKHSPSSCSKKMCVCVCAESLFIPTLWGEIRSMFAKVDFLTYHLVFSFEGEKKKNDLLSFLVMQPYSEFWNKKTKHSLGFIFCSFASSNNHFSDNPEGGTKTD